MTELEITVNETEYNTFKEEHLRELWPPTEAYCNIPECGQTEFFRTFKDYKIHFGKVHTATITLYVCNICKLSRTKVQDMKKHVKTRHKIEDKYHKLNVENKNYVENKDILPYRIGTQAERNLAVQIRAETVKRTRLQREEEQEKRRKIAENVEDHFVEDKYYNARDEKLNFTHNQDKSTMTRTLICKKIID